MTVTEFLLARIAEDEAVAGALPADGYYTDGQRVLEVPPLGDGSQWPRRWSPVRVLAECEAKRHIVELHGENPEPDCRCQEDWVWTPCSTLRALAAVYADHPDYREEWRP